MAPASIEPSALAILQRTPSLLRALLADLDPAVLYRPNPEGCSIKDVVAHLHDAEDIAFVVRVRRLLAEETPFIASIDPPARFREGGYANRTLNELLDDLASQRMVHAAWVATLTPEDLARPGRHDTTGTVTPAAIIHQWAFPRPRPHWPDHGDAPGGVHARHGEHSHVLSRGRNAASPAAPLRAP